MSESDPWRSIPNAFSVMKDLAGSGTGDISYSLRSLDSTSYELAMAWKLKLSWPVSDAHFLFIECADPYVMGTLLAGCSASLFDFVYVPDRILFRDAGARRLTIRIGFDYIDRNGTEGRFAAVEVEPVLVPEAEWLNFFPLFRTRFNGLPQEDEVDFRSSFRMYKVELDRMIGENVSLGSVTSITVGNRSVQPDSGGCFWQVPTPCILRSVTFDVDELLAEGDQLLEFCLISFLPTGGFGDLDRWISAVELSRTYIVKAPVFPGHGFSLVWRPTRSL